jgi:protein TonB
MVQGDVLVMFLIDVTGKIRQPEIIRSVEWSLDEQALQMIRESPDWIPAIYGDRIVKSYKMQPIPFRLEATRRGG